jgi:Domain of unknown function (DUF4266)
VKRFLLFLLVSPLCLAEMGCAVVPQNRRGKLADPMMSLSDDTLDARRKQKLYTTREAAAGGDGAPAGGGCGCQ